MPASDRTPGSAAGGGEHGDCIFCAIVAGRLPAHKIAEDEQTVAFLDINPWTRGHTLVVPRRHCESVLDCPVDDLAAVAAAAQRVAQTLRKRLGCEGINLLSAAGTVAWQSVFHFHVHVIPRYANDGLEPPIHPHSATSDELAHVAEKLRG